MSENHFPIDVGHQLANLVQLLPAARQRLRTLALVSANEGEGTSTCVANLAKHLADQVRARVLMIDCNLYHPMLHELAGADNDEGLTDVISGAIELPSAIKQTRVPTLSLVSSGKAVVYPSLVLEPALLRERLMDRIAGFDFVLLDCPPVNSHFESARLAALCDGVILVVEGEKTRRQAAQNAKAQLNQARCKLLGVFMNKRKMYIPKPIYDRL